MNKKGFTLVELLIVVAIIGILSSVVVITLIGQTDKASDAALKTNLRSLASITSDAVSRNVGYNFTNFCKVNNTDTDDASVTYGVKGIMDSVFESGGYKSSDAVQEVVRLGGADANLYFVVVDSEGDQVKVTSSTTNMIYGCVSNKTGWVAWGQLSQDIDENSDKDYYCLDSSGGNSSTIVTKVPNQKSNIDLQNGGLLNCNSINNA